MTHIISEKENNNKVENIQDFDDRAEKIYFESSITMTDPQHAEYLKKKGLTSADIPGLRFGNYYNDPALIIPIKDINEKIRSIQYIFQDSEGKTQKRFLKDADKKDCFLALDNLKASDQIFITEGIATAGSLRKILSNREQRQSTAVVCAFSAQKIPRVAKSLKETYEFADVIVAPDADRAGDASAMECKTSGIQAIFPPRLEDGTDWNDIHIGRGLKKAVEEIETALSLKAFAESKDIQAIEKILEKIDEDPCKDFSMHHFPPVLREYIESICETTEAHPIMIIMSVLCSISAMVGKKVYMPKSEYFQNLYPNIWSLCITKSGGFKTTALNKGSEIALEEDRKILQIMRDIENRDTEYNPLDDSSKLDAKIQAEILQESLKRPILPARVTAEFLIKYLAQGHKGMILSSEMGEWLGNLQKNHNVDLKQIFTHFYDVDIIPYEHRTKHCGGGIVEKPFITINSVSTVEWIQKQVKADDILSGFFARFLLFAPPAEDKIPPMWPSKNLKHSQTGLEAKRKITETLENLGEVQFIRTKEIDAQGNFIQNSLYQMVLCSKYDDRCKKFLEPYLKRWSPYVVKLAMLFRIIEDPLSNELSTTSLKSATEIIRVAIKSTAKLFEKELGESIDQKKQRKVYELIVRRKSRNQKTLLRNIISSTALDGGTKEYQEVLETLETAGKIECLNPETKNKKDWEYVIAD